LKTETTLGFAKGQELRRIAQKNRRKTTPNIGDEIKGGCFRVFQKKEPSYSGPHRKHNLSPKGGVGKLKKVT